jgi:CheY-like chemotaxis protein
MDLKQPGRYLSSDLNYAHPSDRVRALEVGCSDYLSKPFDRNQLLEVIGKYLK